MDRKERISDRAEELLQERADSGQIATSTKPLGRFTYEIGSPDANSRYAHEDDVTQAFKDAELDYEQSFGLILCEGRR